LSENPKLPAQGQVATPEATNSITERQNEEPFMRLLRARSQTYREASRLLLIQLLFVVLLPVVGAVSALIWPKLGPYVAFTSLVIAVLDEAWLDRLQRRKVKLAAKICEQFDCELLEIPWNKLASGRLADPEQIEMAANAWRGGNNNLRNWYPSEISDAPLRVARIICQRTNAWYDSSLRQSYEAWLLALVCIVFIGCLFVGVWESLSLLDLTATVLTPAAPALIWCLREQFRQRDVVEMSETTKTEAESLSEMIASSECDVDKCLRSSRDLQNGIYARRDASPLMLPLVYRLRRKKMEVSMKAGATQMLTRYRSHQLNSLRSKQ
jgi:hypothetical protein